MRLLWKFIVFMVIGLAVFFSFYKYMYMYIFNVYKFIWIDFQFLYFIYLAFHNLSVYFLGSSGPVSVTADGSLSIAAENTRTRKSTGKFINTCTLNSFTPLIQVTLDGSNSDLSKFSISRSKAAVPFFFLYITKQIYSRSLELPISRSSQSLELSPGSHYTHFIVFHSQSLEVLIC